MNDLHDALESIAPQPPDALDHADIRRRVERRRRMRRLTTGVAALVVITFGASIVLLAGSDDRVAVTSGGHSHAVTATTSTTLSDDDSATGPTSSTTAATMPEQRPRLRAVKPGEFIGTADNTTTLVRFAPYQINVGDSLTVHIDVQTNGRALQDVFLAMPGGPNIRFSDACIGDGKHPNVDWSAEKTIPTDQPEGVYELTVHVETAEYCPPTDTDPGPNNFNDGGASGIVVIRDPRLAPGRQTDDADRCRATHAGFGFHGAPVGLTACEYPNSGESRRVDLGISAYDLDGGNIRSISIDWGDGNIDTTPAGCGTKTMEDFNTAYAASAYTYRYHVYATDGTFTIHVRTTSTDKCAQAVPTQTADTEKAVSIGAPS